MRHTISFIISGLLLASLSFAQDRVPEDLEMIQFSGSDITPSPAALCVAPTGEVFVAVDMNGSLGKGAGKGSIVRLVDSDKDGVADSHTEYAKADSARGLISLGDKLWVLHTTYDPSTGEASGMDLTLFTDADWDGVADGPGQTLVKGICSPESLRSRGTDHSTNGIRMGIDGWIYIAVGDFGFAGARGADGTELTLLGGGIVRVRPDGTEMELYTKGLRNIYDVAIDPFMNVYTRGNTNDGGGWNVRFIHQIQSANYGYPSLFMNFASEILPALEDLGGGSGTGALFLNEPTWPDAYNNQPLMSDWGRNAVFLHRLTPDGPTFTQSPEAFIQLSQVSDLDVDASGQMFLSAWAGATYRGSAEHGYVVRVVPRNWNHTPFASLDDAKIPVLFKSLVSPSATIRLAAQWELMTRSNKKIPERLLTQVRDAELSLEARVAALFTYAQMTGAEGISTLVELFSDPDLAEFAIRAVADRLPWVAEADIDVDAIAAFLKRGTPRQKTAATIALGRLGKKEAAAALLATPYAMELPSIETAVVGDPVLIKGSNKASKFEASLSGYKELHLHSLTYHVGSPRDRSYWLDPIIEFKDGRKISLTELEWKSANTENGPIRKFTDLSQSGLELPKNGNKSVSQALSMPAVSTIVYELPEGAVRLTAKVAMEDSITDDRPGAEFHVTPEPIDGLAKRSEHATPDSGRVLPHLAVQSLTRLQPEDALIEALDSESKDLAHWAIRYQHSESLVDGVLERLDEADDRDERRKLLTTLARLYQKEAPYDGSWWWTTRPDTRGPYYKPVAWSGSSKIRSRLEEEWKKADADEKLLFASLNDSHRLGIETFGTLQAAHQEEEVTVDLGKIASKKGAVATTPIEDVLLSLDKIKGYPSLGRALFDSQGCIACHALDNSTEQKGPFMGQIGSIMTRDQIAEAILRPNATISQGFQTTVISTTDGGTHIGFVTSRNSDEITIRDMTGKSSKVAVSKVKSEDHMPTSMMPPGLANSLSLEEFASLVAFLAEQK